MDYESKLKKFIEENGIHAEHIRSENSVHSICMIGEGRTIVVLVLGSQRASTERVAIALGISRPKTYDDEAVIRLATPEEALERMLRF